VVISPLGYRKRIAAFSALQLTLNYELDNECAHSRRWRGFNSKPTHIGEGFGNRAAHGSILGVLLVWVSDSLADLPFANF
jgi:hypothetical protein